MEARRAQAEGRERLVGAGGFRWCGEWQERKESLWGMGAIELGGGLVNLDFAFGGARMQLFLPQICTPTKPTVWGDGIKLNFCAAHVPPLRLRGCVCLSPPHLQEHTRAHLLARVSMG